MFPALAYADSADPTSMNLEMIVGGVCIFAATVALALILIAIARTRARAGFVTTAVFYWALITAGTLFYAGAAQLNWTREYNIRLDSGYLDPHDTAAAPTLPWKIWGALGVVYGAMLIWSLSQNGKSQTHK